MNHFQVVHMIVSVTTLSLDFRDVPQKWHLHEGKTHSASQILRKVDTTFDLFSECVTQVPSVEDSRMSKATIQFRVRTSQSSHRGSLQSSSINEVTFSIAEADQCWQDLVKKI